MFRALVLDDRNGSIVPSLQEVAEDALSAGDVVVDVAHSTLNYKDGLILAGLGRIVRHYPHIPGIDFAGTVRSSASPQYRPGDPVILTGVGRRRAFQRRICPARPGQGRMARPLAGRPDIAGGDGGGNRRPHRGAGGHRLGTSRIAARRRRGAGHRGGRWRRQRRDQLAQPGRFHRRGLDRPAGNGRLPACAGRPDDRRPRRVGAAGRQAAASCPMGRLHRRRGRRHFGQCDRQPEAGATAWPAATRPETRCRLRCCRSSCAACGWLASIPSTRLTNPASAAWQRIARDLSKDSLARVTQTIGLSDVPEWGARIIKGEVQGRVVIDLHCG